MAIDRPSTTPASANVVVRRRNWSIGTSDGISLWIAAMNFSPSVFPPADRTRLEVICCSYDKIAVARSGGDGS
jgi:hypothetical protein